MCEWQKVISIDILHLIQCVACNLIGNTDSIPIFLIPSIGGFSVFRTFFCFLFSLYYYYLFLLSPFYGNNVLPVMVFICTLGQWPHRLLTDYFSLCKSPKMSNSICAPSSFAVSQLLGNTIMLFVWVHEVQITYRINSGRLISRWYAKTFSSEVSDISTANTSWVCTCVLDTRGIFIMYFIS